MIMETPETVVSNLRIELARPTPSYLQLEQALREAIASRRLSPGSRLPEERELAKDLGLSRGTVRRALAPLEVAGLIVRRKGRGTYIADQTQAPPVPLEVFLRGSQEAKIQTSWIGAIVQGMFEAARRLNAELVLREAGPDAGKNTAAGASLFVAPEDRAAVRRLAASGRAVICVDLSVDGPGIDSVVFDNTLGAREGVRRLIEMGHRRIAFIGALFRRGDGFVESLNAHERLAGYRLALQEAGIAEEFVWWMPADAKDVRARFVPAMRAIPEERRPTAIFGTDESDALGAWLAAQEAGWRVPADLSIASFRNFDAPDPAGIAFSSICISPLQIGVRAVEAALERVHAAADEVSPGTRILVPHRWVAGETAGEIPGGVALGDA
ncbi:MAG: hypothetical protein AMXMBFR7_07800 [Planctomycetota bacterium]